MMSIFSLDTVDLLFTYRWLWLFDDPKEDKVKNNKPYSCFLDYFNKLIFFIFLTEALYRIIMTIMKVHISLDPEWQTDVLLSYNISFRE